MAEAVISFYPCSWLQRLGSKSCILLPYSQPVVLIFLLFLLIVSLQILHWPLWTFLQQLLHNRSAWRLMFGANLTVCPSFQRQVNSLFFFFFKFFNFLTLQYCIDFTIYQHESATVIYVFPILNPPPSSLPIPGQFFIFPTGCISSESFCLASSSFSWVWLLDFSSPDRHSLL